MKKIGFLTLSFIMLILIACEKDIDIVLEGHEEKMVVEGAIEQGIPPYVILTRTVGFFAPTDVNTYENSFIKGAQITVSDGTNSVLLDEFLIDGYTVYSTLNPIIFGQVGKTYSLEIIAEGKILTSTTTIPVPIVMDSYWYQDQPGFTNFGYLWFNLNEPAGLGDAYRIFTQRKGKDARFLPAFGSVFDDKFIDGLDFDAFIFRGQEPNSNAPDDVAETSEYFQQGDTIFIKFCTIDLPHFKFWETFETAAFNEGNPFSAPVSIQSNIQGGGIGVWGGYGVSYDTLIAVDL